jgi:hypothetical protein
LLPRDAALTSAEERLKVEAFEGGDGGARRSDRSGRSLAAAERKLVGSETVEGHSRACRPPAESSSRRRRRLGDDEGLASVAGRAELRHLVQERVNHVASLVGPGLCGARAPAASPS